MHVGSQAKGGGEHEIGAVWFEQVGGADIGVETAGDERHHVHQRLGGSRACGGELPQLFEREEETGVANVGRVEHRAPLRTSSQV